METNKGLRMQIRHTMKSPNKNSFFGNRKQKKMFFCKKISIGKFDLVEKKWKVGKNIKLNPKTNFE